MRIRLLDQLRDGEATVHEIAEGAGASQQNVSKHLHVLHEAGIVSGASPGPRSSTGSWTKGCSSSASRCAAACSDRWLELSAILEGVGTLNRWPLERVLFAMAGTMTLVTVALAALVSPWWLLLTAFVGVSQWLYVTVGECPASLVAERLFGVSSRVSEVA